jgi:hypothetical protein
MFAAKFSLSAVVAVAALGAFHGAAFAETAAQVPETSYYDDPLTPSERSGIAQEESVTPNDGRASVPNPADDGVIPDATIDQSAGAASGPAPSDESLEKRSGNEADEVIKQSKEDYKVTKKDLAGCMKDWGPQTQMTKSEWEASCRTTLEYFPDGH